MSTDIHTNISSVKQHSSMVVWNEDMEDQQITMIHESLVL